MGGGERGSFYLFCWNCFSSHGNIKHLALGQRNREWLWNLAMGKLNWQRDDLFQSAYSSEAVFTKWNMFNRWNWENLDPGFSTTVWSELSCKKSRAGRKHKRKFHLYFFTYRVDIRLLGEWEKAIQMLSKLLNRCVREGHIRCRSWKGLTTENSKYK